MCVETMEKTKNEIQIPISSTATERIKRLRKDFFKYNPSIDIERAQLMYEMYQSGELDGQPVVIINARLFENLVKKKTIYIEDDQLIAGSFGSRPKASPVYPEAIGISMLEEFRKSVTRSIDPFEYSENDRKKLEFILHNMREFPSMRVKFYDSLTEEKKFFLKHTEKDYATVTQICSIEPAINGSGGHINPDFQTVIEEGFDKIKRRAKVRLVQAEAEKDEKAIHFLRAAIITMDAIGILAQRYSDLAKEKANKETNPLRKKELLRIAEACAHVPMYPARSFYEVCQSVWLVFVGIQLESCQRCLSIGRFDQIAYPYYKVDIDNGILTHEEAQEILDCLWMKFTETNHFNSESYSHSVAGFVSHQHFICGGQTPDGRDATNELSYMQIQASINTRLAQPSISVRLWEGTPTGLIEKACELARLGTGHPSFFNDRVIIPALMDKDIILEDARDYGIVGCAGVQPTRKDKGVQNGGYINLAACLDFALHDGYWKHGNMQMGLHTGDPTTFKIFDEFFDAVKAQFAHLIKVQYQVTVKCEIIHRDFFPTPFLSCIVQDCITRALDCTAGGAFYNMGSSAKAVGLADVADSLAAVKKLVYEEQKISMQELMQAIDADFEGYEELRKLLQTGAPHYGNNIDDVDMLAVELTEFYCEEVEKYRSLFGGKLSPGFGTVSANIPYGEVVAALPTGRKAYKPLADGISPRQNRDTAGQMACVISASKINHVGINGGSVLNLRFSPNTFAGDKGLKDFAAFIKTVMEYGIWHIQFSVNDVEILKNAQKHPEKYQDLLISVAGYSALFVRLPKALQTDIIGRFQNIKAPNL